MKRSIFLAMAIIVLAATVACGEADRPAAGFGPEDLYLDVGEAQYRLGTNIETVLAHLGEGYEYSEGISCDYDGLDKAFLYEDVEFYTWPMPEGDLVNEIYSQSPRVATSRGLAVGAAKKDVLAAYGEGAEDTGYQLLYSAEGGALCFDLENDVVTAVSITSRPV